MTPEDLYKHQRCFGSGRHEDRFHVEHKKMDEYPDDAEGQPTEETKPQPSQWRPSNRNQGSGEEYDFAERQDFIVKTILQRGDGTKWTAIGAFEYRLSYKNGKPLWVTKRPQRS